MRNDLHELLEVLRAENLKLHKDILSVQEQLTSAIEELEELKEWIKESQEC